MIPLGFLLGKFVSERNYKIRQMTQPEYVTVIKQIQALRRSIETTSQNISESTMPHRHPKYNSLFWDEARSCSDRSIEHNFNLSFNDFVERLIDNELDVIHQCFIKFQNLVNTIAKD